MESSLSAKEKIYKERINGLEEQVTTFNFSSSRWDGK
jgi:hypothetical protein